MAVPAKYLGFSVTVLDPSPDCPASGICDKLIVAGFDDEDAIRRLLSQTDVCTYEFEHIATKALDEYRGGACVYPTVKSLKTIQNKFTQKKALETAGLSVPKFSYVSRDRLSDVALEFGYPFMLKSCTGGYDGKGNAIIRSEKDFENALDMLKGDLMAEEFIDFVCEMSVIAVRSINGETAVYPIAHNIHKDNILFETKTLSDLPCSNPEIAKDSALETARKVMRVFDGVGVFVVEMFLTKNGEVYVNEVAPRVHNSGHFTIEACICSQFESHIRAITGLPLGSTKLLQKACMRNLLGEDGFSGKTKVLGLHEALGIEGVHIHIYGKSETRPKRKMGHLTATADTVEEAERLAEMAYSAIKIVSSEG